LRWLERYHAKRRGTSADGNPVLTANLAPAAAGPETAIDQLSGPAAPNEDPAWEVAGELLQSVNDNAANARTIYVSYILLALYIFITVGSTNDEQLLRDGSIAIPFLNNVNLPVSRFYLAGCKSRASGSGSA
jgi:hypothetical protein